MWRTAHPTAHHIEPPWWDVSEGVQQQRQHIFDHSKILKQCWRRRASPHNPYTKSSAVPCSDGCFQEYLSGHSTSSEPARVRFPSRDTHYAPTLKDRMYPCTSFRSGLGRDCGNRQRPRIDLPAVTGEMSALVCGLCKAAASASQVTSGQAQDRSDVAAQPLHDENLPSRFMPCRH